MDRWIRWKSKGAWSLWHRAPPANAYVRIWKRSSSEEIEIREYEAGPVRSPTVFERRTIYRYTACGFSVPPHEMTEEWTGPALPPLRRCIWCVHGWIVDTAPPSGAPPAQEGGPGPIVIRARGKKPPTQHA